jgi:hypothetical protein
MGYLPDRFFKATPSAMILSMDLLSVQGESAEPPVQIPSFPLLLLA